MPYMGGLIGQGLAEYRVGQEAGAKGLPEGFARLLGHDVLAVVAGNQHYQVVGFDAAFSANMQFSLGGHLWHSLSYGGANSIRLSCTYYSYARYAIALYLEAVMVFQAPINIGSEIYLSAQIVDQGHGIHRLNAVASVDGVVVAKASAKFIEKKVNDRSFINEE